MIDTIARVPPCDRASERAVIGAILIDGSAIWPAREIVEPAHFHDTGCREVYEAACAVADSGTPVDMLTVRAELERRGRWSEHTEAMLHEAIDNEQSAANVAHYARAVRSKARLRSLAKAGERLVAACYDPGADADKLASLAAGTILRLAGDRPRDTLVQIQQVMLETAARAENPQRAAAGIGTGLDSLDAVFGGLRPDELIVLAARPSMGKTALAVGMIRAAAMLRTPPVRVLFASLEMGRDQIGVNMLGQMTGLNTKAIAAGALNTIDLQKVLDAAARVYDHAPIAIDDGAGMNVTQLRARLEADGKVGLVVIDYLQLMGDPPCVSKRANRCEIVGANARELKAIAKERHIPVVVLAQLNRSVEARDGNKPRMSDLRESGEIEAHADVVLLLHRPEYYSKKPEDSGKAIIDVAKNRNGTTGEVEVRFTRQCVRFSDLPDGQWRSAS